MKKSYYLDKEGKRRYLKSCALCFQLIKDPLELERVKLSVDVLEEINGTPYIKATLGLTDYRYVHKNCLKKLDLPTKRKLLCEDWTTRLLNVDHGIWVELDEYGKPKWDTLYSDEEKIDKEIQRLKKKGIKNLDPKEKAWLKELIR